MRGWTMLAGWSEQPRVISMSSKRDEERNLLVLLSAIEAATKPSQTLVADLLRHAWPRFNASFRPGDLVRRPIEAEAWVDL